MDVINKKLGLKEGMDALFIKAPEVYFQLITLHGITVKKRAIPDRLDFLHIFVTKFTFLAQNIQKYKAALKKDGLIWISWPKGGSSIPTDINRDIIRAFVLENGLVDVKVASINEDWSALKFVYRLRDR